jgi:hypothetical protein
MIYVIQVLLTAEHSNGICHTGFGDTLFSCQQSLYDIDHFCVYSEKLLMMDGGNVRNM